MLSPIYTYIKNIWFCLAGFYGISTIVGYLIQKKIFKWFQVLLYNSHNLAPVLCLHTICSIWHWDVTLAGANTLSQSGGRRKSNVGVLHTPQISKAAISPSDFLCHILDTPWWVFLTTQANWARKIRELNFWGTCLLRRHFAHGCVSQCNRKMIYENVTSTCIDLFCAWWLLKSDHCTSVFYFSFFL